MTTTRPVFFSVNTATGSSFYKNVFERDQNNLPLTFGEILRRTKNMVYSDVNKHSFTLIGDPALRLALPKLRVIIDSINGFAADSKTPTQVIRPFDQKDLKGFSTWLKKTQGADPQNVFTLKDGVLGVAMKIWVILPLRMLTKIITLRLNIVGEGKTQTIKMFEILVCFSMVPAQMDRKMAFGKPRSNVNWRKDARAI